MHTPIPVTCSLAGAPAAARLAGAMWILAVTGLVCGVNRPAGAAESPGDGGGLAIVTIKYTAGKPVKIETHPESMDWTSQFDIVAWLKAPAGGAAPSPSFTVSKLVRYPDSTNVPAQDLADNMKDDLYLMRIGAAVGAAAGTGGEMWLIGKKGNRAAIQAEVDGMHDVEKIQGGGTAAERCKAFLDATASTKSPSFVLALEADHMCQPDLPDAQRMDIVRGLVKLMLHDHSSDDPRREVSRSLDVGFRDRRQELAACQYVLSQCTSKLNEFSREPGKDIDFEFIVLQNTDVLLRTRELRSTPEFHKAMETLAKYKGIWRAQDKLPRDRDAVLKVLGGIEREVDAKQ